MKFFKQISLIGVTTVLILSSFTPEKGTESKIGLAKVSKMDGVEVYFMSEPLRKYSVVVESGGLLGNASVKSLATGGMMTPTASDKANQLVKNAVKNATKDGKQIDAVIYSNAKSAVGVKFTEDANENNDGIGKVKKIAGVDVYAFSEPLAPYEMISEGKAKAHGGSFATGGILNSSIEDDLTKLVEKAKDDAGRQVGQLSAVIYNSGKTGIGIKYK